MKTIIKNLLLGIAWGCTMLVLMLSIGVLVDENFLSSMSASYFIKNVICSIIVANGFVISSLVYNNNKIPHQMQILIHMGTGFLIYFPVAYYAKWIPVNNGIYAILSFVITTIFISIIIWFCFYMYYKNEAKKINDKIREKEKKQ